MTEEIRKMMQETKEQPQHVTVPVKESTKYFATKEMLESTKAYTPWGNTAYDNGRFETWYEWSQSSQWAYILAKLTVADAHNLYLAFYGACWECHYNHSLLKGKDSKI